jgi:hypothetical protein
VELYLVRIADSQVPFMLMDMTIVIKTEGKPVMECQCKARLTLPEVFRDPQAIALNPFARLARTP